MEESVRIERNISIEEWTSVPRTEEEIKSLLNFGEYINLELLLRCTKGLTPLIVDNLLREYPALQLPFNSLNKNFDYSRDSIMSDNDLVKSMDILKEKRVIRFRLFDSEYTRSVGYKKTVTMSVKFLRKRYTKYGSKFLILDVNFEDILYIEKTFSKEESIVGFINRGNNIRDEYLLWRECYQK